MTLLSLGPADYRPTAPSLLRSAISRGPAAATYSRFRIRWVALLQLAVVVALSGCADRVVTAPDSERATPWQSAVAEAARDAGLRGLVGVQLLSDGAATTPLRLIAGADQSDALLRANRLFAGAMDRRRLGHSTAVMSKAAAVTGLFRVAPSGVGLSPTTYTYTTQWGCQDEQNGGAWEPIAVFVDPWNNAMVPGSGGHNHAAGIATTGSWSPATGVTGGDGVWTSTFTAPSFSVEERLEYSVTGVSRCTGTANVSETYSIGIDGLADLGTGTGYTLVGSTSTHVSNHYGTPAFNAALKTLASRFHAKYNKNLLYNDMSLVEGGGFDWRADWGPSHAEHRIGRNIDVQSNAPHLTPVQRKFVQAEWERLGGSVHDETTTARHFHLRY